MRKAERHLLIKKMIQDNQIKKQEDFVEVLAAQGIEVTQATISRDMKEMKLLKVPIEGNSYRYTLPETAESEMKVKLEKLLKDSFISMKDLDKLLVIHTIPGNGPAMGNLIEKVYSEYLFTVVTNDDKILVITQTEAALSNLRNQLLMILQS